MKLFGDAKPIGLPPGELILVGQQKIDETKAAMLAADGSENTDWPIYGTGSPATRTNSLTAYYLDAYNNYVDNQHQLLPIPEQEVGANELIKQNPNW